MNEQIVKEFRTMSAQIVALSREARRIPAAFQSHKDRLGMLRYSQGRLRTLRERHEAEYDEADWRDRQAGTGSYTS